MSLAKLTSISTKTLSLLLERQRLQTLPSFITNAASPLEDSSATANGLHLTQIKKNLEQLRNGIVAMEAKEGSSEAVGLLRNQYERMRGMLGPDGEGLPSLNEADGRTSSPSPPESRSSPSPAASVSPSPPVRPPTREPLPSVGLSSSRGVSKQAALFLSSSSTHGRSDSDAVFAPYKDDPSGSSGKQQQQPEFNDDEPAVLLQTQRYMMDEQDQRLDQLSHSINRQHHISVQIGDEMDVHAGLLEELDSGIDRTSGRLGSARKGLDRVAKGIKENSSVVAIGALIFILLILIIVVKT